MEHAVGAPNEADEERSIMRWLPDSGGGTHPFRQVPIGHDSDRSHGCNRDVAEAKGSECQ